jgi:hypothetical protein
MARRHSKVNHLRTLAVLSLFPGWCTAHFAGAAPPQLIEIAVGDTKYVGKSLAHTADACCLVAADGRLTQVELKDVTGYRKVAPTFRALSVIDARDQLARELGRTYELSTRGKYVVAGPPGKTRPFVDLLDQVHRSFTRFFSQRDFGLTQPEFPLIAIVMPDQKSFADYCRRDGMRFSPGLRGYYDAYSNRVALYVGGDSLARGEPPRPVFGVDVLVDTRPGTSPLTMMGEGRFATIQADLRDTLVHEATHQLAFNMGLHPRIGENPRWVVEGLAMIFEREMTPQAPRTQAAESRINEERFEWFTHQARNRYTKLPEFVAGDRPFAVATLDAYSQAWALTYYLAEKRPADFADYLQLIRGREPLTPYSAEQRLADFRKSFGDDVAWVEVQWLRFMDGLR